ncbi:glycosyltransferase [Candidatus Woesearchaeota archaeon]|nr:glycosyltransferase [Candidatus Woesearchaeota archaeon]
MSISVCMIAKDESENIERCLESVKDIADEIIIGDTGSKDNTKEIAKRYTKKVFDISWDHDFSKARNECMLYATKRWIFVIGADEAISSKDSDKIMQLIKDDTAIGYKFTQRNYSDRVSSIKWRSSQRDGYEESSNFKGWQYRGIIRLFRNNKGIRFRYPVHESVLPAIKDIKGKIKSSNIPIHHFQKYSIDKEQYYYQLLQKKILEFPEANSFAEMALHCYEIGLEKEAKDHKKAALELNRNLGDALSFIR